MPMEERLAITTTGDSLHHRDAADSSPDATYVVQIPRDQIYRVPPPEHARIYEDHTARQPKRSSGGGGGVCCCRVICIILTPIVILAALAGITYAILRNTLYKPEVPAVSITRLVAREGRGKRPPEFEITLQAKGRNPHLSVEYRHAAGAVTALVYRNDKIGQGRMKGISAVRGDGGTAVNIPLVLYGVSARAEDMRSLEDSGGAKVLELDVEMPMEMKSWARNEKRVLMISCDVKVQNLFNNTKISSQECKENF